MLFSQRAVMAFDFLAKGRESRLGHRYWSIHTFPVAVAAHVGPAFVVFDVEMQKRSALEVKDAGLWFAYTRPCAYPFEQVCEVA